MRDENVTDETAAPVFDATPDARSYTHLNCQGSTVISGVDFMHLADPYYMLRGTWCVVCRRMDTPDRFVWRDAGEVISAYRGRLRSLPPAVAGRRTPRWLILIPAVVICSLVGEWVSRRGHLFAPNVAYYIGAFLGLMIGQIVFRAVQRSNSADYRKYR